MIDKVTDFNELVSNSSDFDCRNGDEKLYHNMIFLLLHFVFVPGSAYVVFKLVSAFCWTSYW